MLRFELRCSRLELLFASTCHLCALVTVLTADMPVLLVVLVLAVVIASYTNYLLALYLNFVRPMTNRITCSPALLVIGQQSAQVSQFGKMVATELPVVGYMSEFLLVLNLHQELVDTGHASGAGRHSAKPVKLVLWPDSLSRRDNRRLRRYLRFDCPNG